MKTVGFPEWAVFAIGYSVFLWSSLTLITMQSPTPDILMAGFLYLAVGLLLRLWARPQKLVAFCHVRRCFGFRVPRQSRRLPARFPVLCDSVDLGRRLAPGDPARIIAVLAFSAVSRTVDHGAFSRQRPLYLR